MRSRIAYLFLSIAAFASCGASCKKSQPDSVAAPEDTPIIELNGVDTSPLTVSEKREFSKVVHDAMSPCGDPVTIEVCVKESRACNKCAPAAKAAAKLVAQGANAKEAREWIEGRFEAKAIKSIDVSNTPSIGPSDAPLQIIEFADFECPHCGAAAPILHKLIETPEFKPKVRFYFKNYPLPMHTHAESAAWAAVAAGQQGKFWEMHEQLFAHQEQLGTEDILGYAKKLGLNIDKFKLDWEASTTKERVAADKKIGQDIGVNGTPSIFVNGRMFLFAGHADFADQLTDWWRTELTLGSAAPAPSQPSAPASGATSASAAPSSSAAASAAASGSSSAKPK
jgi:predicted DsbA family dithiol-disulfide isomerase